MASVTFNSAGATATSDSSNSGTPAWTNPSNVGADDGSRAVASVIPAAGMTEYLKVIFAAITFPDAVASIDGIEFNVECSASNANPIQDIRFRAVKGGTIGSTDKSVATNWANLTDTFITHGGPTELFGLTWTEADFASGFGLALAATKISGGSTNGRVDWITGSIYYTPATFKQQAILL